MRAIIILGLLTIEVSNVSAEMIFDAVDEFSTASNGDGVWSYHYSDDTTRDGEYPLLAQSGPLGSGPAENSTVWHADSGVATAQRPYAGVNTTTSGVSSWAVGELALHPGPSNGGSGAGLAALSWTSPVTGTADVSIALTMGLNGDIDWFLERFSIADQLVTTFDSGNLSGNLDAVTILRPNVAINFGDQLNLVLDSNGSVGSDLVRVNTATITATAIPELSSISLVSLAMLIGLILRRTRHWADTPYELLPLGGVLELLFGVTSMRVLVALCALVCVHGVSIAQYPRTFDADVLSIADGDTIRVRDDAGAIHRIRFNSVDTPELAQDFGTVARDFIVNKIGNDRVTIEAEGEDQFGRLIAVVKVNGENLNEELLRAGLGWWFYHYSDDTSLALLEAEAKAMRRVACL